MKAQSTTTTTTTIRKQALSRLFDAVTLVFGLVLAGGGLAVLSTEPQDDVTAVLAGLCIPTGLVLLAVLVGEQVWRHGVLAAVATSCRVLLVVAAGLALLGIWADVPTPVPSWRQDVMAWQVLGVLTLLLGLVELPALLFLLRVRTAWQRELLGLQAVVAWLPFGWLLLFYPYAPVWAGSRDGVHQILPELLCLAVIALTAALQILIRWHWHTLAAREAAALPSADGVEPMPRVQVWLLEDGDKPVGVNLGRLPEIYGTEIAYDLPAALWLIPAGVVVRVSYLVEGRRHYQVEGPITGFEDGGVFLDEWWIGGEDIDLTGLVILDDRRTPASCALTRTPLLLPAPSDAAVAAGPAGVADTAAVTPDGVTLREQRADVPASSQSDEDRERGDAISSPESRSVSVLGPQ